MSEPYRYIDNSGTHPVEIAIIPDGWRDGRGCVDVGSEVAFLPANERPAAAQALVGDEYRVVPVEQTTWACARCYGAPQTHAGGGVNDECLYEPILLINEAPQPVRQKDPAYTDEDWRQQIGRVLSLLGIEDGVIRRPPVDVIDTIRGKIDNLYSLIQRIGHERDDLRKQVHEAEAQAAQPDRPEPIEEGDLRKGDRIELTLTGTVEATDDLIVLRADDDTLMSVADYGGSVWRVLHSPEPEVDADAVEAMEVALANVGIYAPHDAALRLVRDHGVQVGVSE